MGGCALCHRMAIVLIRAVTLCVQSAEISALPLAFPFQGYKAAISDRWRRRKSHTIKAAHCIGDPQREKVKGDLLSVFARFDTLPPILSIIPIL